MGVGGTERIEAHESLAFSGSFEFLLLAMLQVNNSRFAFTTISVQVDKPVRHRACARLSDHHVEAQNSLFMTEFAGRNDIHPLPRAFYKCYHLGRSVDDSHFWWTRQDLSEI